MGDLANGTASADAPAGEGAPAADRFAEGARALVGGAVLIWRNRPLWPYAAAPVAVALVALLLGAWAGVRAAGWLVEGQLAGWTSGVAGAAAAALTLLAYVLGALVGAIAGKVVALAVLGGPLNEMLSERVEAIVTGRAAPEQPLLQALAATVRDAIPGILRGAATALYRVAVLVVFAPLLLIPGLGPLLYLAPTAYIEALGALDVTFGRKRMGLGEKRAWLARRRASVVGFGAAILLANVLVPVVGALVVVPAAAAGGTLLVIGEETA